MQTARAWIAVLAMSLATSGACRSPGDDREAWTEFRIESTEDEVKVGGMLDLDVWINRGGELDSTTPLTWSSSNQQLATVDPRGVVRGVAVGGPVLITVTDGEFTDSIVLHVTPAAIASLVFGDDAVTLGVGQSKMLTVVALDSVGQPVREAATWKSGDESVVTVLDGVLTGRREGSCEVRATLRDKSASVWVYVRGSLSELLLMPAEATLEVGGELQLYAEAKQGASWFYDWDPTWTSSDPKVATVADRGFVKGMGAGTAQITASAGGITRTALIRVETPGEPMLSAGPAGACALTRLRQAYCWGAASAGTSSTPATPQRVQGEHSFQTLSVGVENVCGLTTAGRAYCWGVGHGASFGDGTALAGTVTHLVPHAVASALAFVSLSTGKSNTVAITADGAAYIWGATAHEALGTVMAATASVQALMPERKFKQASLDQQTDAACMLDLDGAAFCFGADVELPGVPGPQRRPVAMPTSLRFKSVSVRAGLAVGVSLDGRLHEWKLRAAASPTGAQQALTPELLDVPGVVFEAVSRGGSMTLALDTAGTVHGWGRLTVTTPQDESTAGTTYFSADRPTPLSTKVRAFAAGGQFVVLFAEDGRLMGIGDQGRGQLGDGELGTSSDGRNKYRALLGGRSSVAFSMESAWVLGPTGTAGDIEVTNNDAFTIDGTGSVYDLMVSGLPQTAVTTLRTKTLLPGQAHTVLRLSNEGAPSGMYSFQVTVSQGGRIVQTLPAQLKVWN
jgi:uncharacterized protein YjdB